MAVWGIGATWDDVDVSKEFIGYKTAAIGYDRAEKDTYHKMMEEVKVGDLFFIKSKFHQNSSLSIKAIGFVLDNKLCLQNGYEKREGVKINWVKNLTDCPEKFDGENEWGSTRTLYKVEDERLIKLLIELL